MKKILSLILAIMLLCSISIPAFADTPDGSTIDLTRTGSINLWKYDLSSAEMDGVWDSSYVSTGVRDENGVEAILGNPDRVSPLNPSGESYGYAIKGVQFTYLKVASLKEYTVTEGDAQRTELLYGIAANEAGTAFLSALGLSAADRFTPADEPEGSATTYYFRSDVLIDGPTLLPSRTLWRPMSSPMAAPQWPRPMLTATARLRICPWGCTSLWKPKSPRWSPKPPRLS